MFHELSFGCKSMLNVPDFIFCFKSLISQIKPQLTLLRLLNNRHCVCKEFVALVVGICKTVYNVYLHKVISYINTTMVFCEKIGQYPSFCQQVYHHDSMWLSAVFLSFGQVLRAFGFINALLSMYCHSEERQSLTPSTSFTLSLEFSHLCQHLYRRKRCSTHTCYEDRIYPIILLHLAEQV